MNNLKFLKLCVVFAVIFILAACGGSEKDAATAIPALSTARPADGLHLIESDSNTALIVAGNQALIYSRYTQSSQIESLLSIDLYGNTTGLHANKSNEQLIAVTGGFKHNVYYYKCADPQDAGKGCINDYQKRTFKNDLSRSLQRPSLEAINNNYQQGQWHLTLYGNEVDFIINIDNGSSINFDLNASSTEWGIYTLSAKQNNTKGIIVFYQVNDKSYFDLLFYDNQKLNVNLNQITL